MLEPTLHRRFWDKVAVSDPMSCWVWLGSVSPSGYGWFRLGGKNHRSHRVAYAITHGRWPTPCCLHACDNPSCVNPAHLREGTQQENLREMTAKGRRFTPEPMTVCRNGHLMEGANVYVNPGGDRRCRECARVNRRNYRRRRGGSSHG